MWAQEVWMQSSSWHASNKRVTNRCWIAFTYTINRTIVAPMHSDYTLRVSERFSSERQKQSPTSVTRRVRSGDMKMSS